MRRGFKPDRKARQLGRPPHVPRLGASGDGARIPHPSGAADRALAFVAHELRQELHTAVAAAAIAETGIATDSARRANAVLMRCLLGMSRLVDDLLEQSRIVFGKIELQRRPVRLADLVGAAVQGVAPGARKKRQELRVELAPPDIWLHVDPLRVGQVLNNLLSNAVRYTREGGHVTVRVALQGGTASVIIEDDGPGIPEDLLPHVFEPFVRGSIVEKGLGLGLPLALALTELHGGTIDVQNVPGGGARFTVRLPAVPPPR